MNLIPSKPNAKTPVLKLILSLTIALVMHLSANSQNPTPTNRHITISELTARKSLQYKIDADNYYRQSVKKDTIIATQDTIIARQKKKLFWVNTEKWAWRGLAVITIIKLIPKK